MENEILLQAKIVNKAKLMQLNRVPDKPPLAGLHFRKLQQLFESLAPPEELAEIARRIGENYRERLLSIDLPIIAAQVI